MKKFHCLVGLASALAVFPACTLITDFDPEGKACDGLRRCEDGYYCRIEDETNGTGRCMKGKNPSTESGFLPLSADVSSEGGDDESGAARVEGAESGNSGGDGDVQDGLDEEEDREDDGEGEEGPDSEL